MARVHEEYLKEYLNKDNKIYLSNELIKELKSKFLDLTEENCRKIISRMNNAGAIKSSKPITFGKNQYAYGNDRVIFSYNNLKSIIKIHKRYLNRVITKIYKENVMTENEVLKLSASTRRYNKNKVSFETIVNELKYLKLINEFTYEGIKFFCLYDKDAESLIKRKYEEMQQESIIIPMALNWLWSSNIITTSYLYRGKQNRYLGIEQSNVVFDAQSFTRSTGYNLVEDKKNAIVVVDFCVSKKYEEFDFEGFYERVQILINSTKDKKRKVVPIIMAKSYSPSALKLIKSKSYISFNISSILGDRFQEIITEYSEILGLINSNEEIDDSKIIIRFTKLVKEIKNNINYSNIKGDFFEYIMESALKKIYNKVNENVGRNVLIEEDGKKYEADIIITTKEEYIFIELKAYGRENIIMLGEKKENGKFAQNTIKWFVGRNYEFFKQKYKNNPENRKCKFCYITTSHFSEEAKEFLIKRNESKEKSKKLDCYYDYEKLCKLLKENGCKEELKLIKQYF